MIRATLLASAAICASPAMAQDHTDHSAHQPAGDAQDEPAMDHCAMGHLPPEQCPTKADAESHAGMDHAMSDQPGMDHSTHNPAPGAAGTAQRQSADEPQIDHGTMDHDTMDHGTMDHGTMDHGTMDHDAMGHGAMDHGTMGHGAMDHGSMDHAAMGHGAMDKSAAGAAPEQAVPPRALEGPQHAADAFWGAQPMAAARKANHQSAGGMATGVVMVERLEARIPLDGGDTGYVWDAQGWYGGDIDKLYVKTEGEGELAGSLEDAEVQLLWSHAIGPFWDLQAGARLDIEPETRSHLALGVQGLAPYMFHVDAAAFLSDRGDLTARIEAEYDQKVTQRLILQPRMEVELSAQDITEREIGAGITKIEPGLRLRYEIAREFAPYVGLEYEAKVGKTADIARAKGADPDGFKLLVGLRAWF